MTRFRISGKNWEGRSWVLTAGGVTLAREVEAIWPDKHPADGTVASKNHDRNNPNSDHRPRPFTGPGIVRALDVGENVEDDGIEFAEMLRASRDPRIKYVLHENRIFSSYSRGSRGAWEWAPLAIGHPSHVHVSLEDRADSDPRPWNLKGDDVSFAKGLTEGEWRTLYQRGVAKGSSEEAVVDYWVRQSANRTEAEFDRASAAMFVELSGKDAGGHNHDGRYLRGVEGVT